MWRVRVSSAIDTNEKEVKREFEEFNLVEDSDFKIMSDRRKYTLKPFMV